MLFSSTSFDQLFWNFFFLCDFLMLLSSDWSITCSMSCTVLNTLMFLSWTCFISPSIVAVLLSITIWIKRCGLFKLGMYHSRPFWIQKCCPRIRYLSSGSFNKWLDIFSCIFQYLFFFLCFWCSSCNVSDPEPLVFPRPLLY